MIEDSHPIINNIVPDFGRNRDINKGNGNMRTDTQSKRNKDVSHSEYFRVDEVLQSVVSSFETECGVVKEQFQLFCEDLKSRGYEKLDVLFELLEMISDAYAFYRQSYSSLPTVSGKEIEKDPYCHLECFPFKIIHGKITWDKSFSRFISDCLLQVTSLACQLSANNACSEPVAVSLPKPELRKTDFTPANECHPEVSRTHVCQISKDKICKYCPVSSDFHSNSQLCMAILAGFSNPSVCSPPRYSAGSRPSSFNKAPCADMRRGNISELLLTDQFAMLFEVEHIAAGRMKRTGECQDKSSELNTKQLNGVYCQQKGHGITFDPGGDRSVFWKEEQSNIISSPTARDSVDYCSLQLAPNPEVYDASPGKYLRKVNIDERRVKRSKGNKTDSISETMIYRGIRPCPEMTFGDIFHSIKGEVIVKMLIFRGPDLNRQWKLLFVG